MNKAQHSPETKAAVMAALLAGQSISEASKQFGLPRGTIATWSRELDRPVIQDDTQKTILGTLIVDYVQECLKTLRAQVKAVADETWIKQQPASEIAVLHGVIADKTIRLLEALTPTTSSNGGDTAS